MKKPNAKAEAVLEVINAQPGFPSRTLARLLVDKYPGLFRDVEDARRVVRRYRGTHGAKNRSGLRTIIPKESDAPTIYPLPEPIADRTTEWKVRKLEFDRCFLLSDLQIPFHHPVALSAAIAHGKDRNPDLVLVNGDYVDFYHASTFDRDPRRRFRLADEIEWGKTFFEHLRDSFPKARIVAKEGNHEERLARNLWRDAPELATVRLPDGSPCVDLEVLLDMKAFRIESVGDKRPILLGEHLYVLHGHEFRGQYGPANPAKWLYDKTRVNAICGHFHRTQQHTESGLDRLVSTWSTGCLCQLYPEFMPVNKWNHGFAMVESHRGSWSVTNHKIINGKVV